MDSVFVNDTNVTDATLLQLEGKYGFWIGEELVNSTSYSHSNAIVFKGQNKSYEFEYFTVENFDKIFGLGCEAEALFPDSNRAPVYGMYYPIKRGVNWEYLKLTESILKIKFYDTIDNTKIVNYFSPI